MPEGGDTAGGGSPTIAEGAVTTLPAGVRHAAATRERLRVARRARPRQGALRRQGTSIRYSRTAHVRERVWLRPVNPSFSRLSPLDSASSISEDCRPSSYSLREPLARGRTGAGVAAGWVWGLAAARVAPRRKRLCSGGAQAGPLLRGWAAQHSQAMRRTSSKHLSRERVEFNARRITL